jgi:predicted dehydrogenase
LSGLNIMSMGIWYETLMRWVGEAVRVYARGAVGQPARRCPRTGGIEPVRIPDHLTVAADLACGAPLSMLISGVAGGVCDTSLTVYGSEGTLRFSADDGRLCRGRRGEPALQEAPAPADAPGWRVEEDFVASIREGRPVTLTSFEDGVRYMAFTQAVADSLAAAAGGEPRAVPVAALP